MTVGGRSTVVGVVKCHVHLHGFLCGGGNKILSVSVRSQLCILKRDLNRDSNFLPFYFLTMLLWSKLVILLGLYFLISEMGTVIKASWRSVEYLSRT